MNNGVVMQMFIYAIGKASLAARLEAEGRATLLQLPAACHADRRRADRGGFERISIAQHS